MLSGMGSGVLDRARCCAPHMHTHSVASALDFVVVKAPGQHAWTAPERQRLCMCVCVCACYLPLPPSASLPPSISLPPLLPPLPPSNLPSIFSPPPLPFCVHVCRVWILVCV
jgi:hypothetical protein